MISNIGCCTIMSTALRCHWIPRCWSFVDLDDMGSMGTSSTWLSANTDLLGSTSSNIASRSRVVLHWHIRLNQHLRRMLSWSASLRWKGLHWASCVRLKCVEWLLRLIVVMIAILVHSSCVLRCRYCRRACNYPISSAAHRSLCD